jgi:hypothetical protein
VEFSDAHQDYFDCYINGEFDARMIDLQRRQGTGPITYAGLLLGQDAENNVEDFVVAAEDLNQPPAAFSLLEPVNGAVIYSLSPAMRWQPAPDPNPGDILSYTVVYDTDPGFPSPDTLAAVTATETVFTANLAFGETYYWKVRAATAGAEAYSPRPGPSPWPILTDVDDFNRSTLGPNWSGDTSVMRIDETSSRTPREHDLRHGDLPAADQPGRGPDHLEPTAGNEGIRRGGFAVRMNNATGGASGYGSRSIRWSTRAGSRRSGAAASVSIASADGATNSTGPGKRFRCAISSDASGHHFDLFVNDVFHSRVSDANKRQGNAATWYVGVGPGART